MVPLRKTTKNRYEQRVREALDYIHENLENPIDLKDVAKAGSFSQYHFHRIFSALVGETLNEYIRRKRMEMAVVLLVCSKEKSITDIAYQCGFSSSSNFSKAFSAYFSCSPKEVKHPEQFKENSKIGELKRKYGKDFDPRKLYPEFIKPIQETRMNIEIIEIKEKRVCVLESAEGYDEKSIFETWDKLCEWAANNRLVGSDFFGVCYDDPNITPTKKCRYEAAVTVKEDTVIVHPFQESKMPSGKYAMAYYRGPEDPNGSLHTRIYREWFPQSGFEPDDFPLIERYLNDSREDGFVEMQILIKIKS
ncbi:MAG: AraC family transcriptional regulator [Alphaproteobacteria bacterium]